MLVGIRQNVLPLQQVPQLFLMDSWVLCGCFLGGYGKPKRLLYHMRLVVTQDGGRMFNYVGSTTGLKALNQSLCSITKVDVYFIKSVRKK